MNVAQRIKNASTDEKPADKLYMENTLLRVAGALLCHDAKRAPTHTKQIELNKGVAEKRVVLRPDPELGQPGPLAHKLFVALIKKHSGYGRPIQNEVSFTKRELMRLIGRAEWGGSASEQLTRALREIHYTFITTNFKAKNNRLAEHSFNIFSEIYLERAELASDPIEACTVTLARPIVASLQDGHFTCLNHALMQELGTIGQAFYMRLFFTSPICMTDTTKTVSRFPNGTMTFVQNGWEDLPFININRPSSVTSLDHTCESSFGLAFLRPTQLPRPEVGKASSSRFDPAQCSLRTTTGFIDANKAAPYASIYLATVRASLSR